MHPNPNFTLFLIEPYSKNYPKYTQSYPQYTRSYNFTWKILNKFIDPKWSFDWHYIVEKYFRWLFICWWKMLAKNICWRKKIYLAVLMLEKRCWRKIYVFEKHKAHNHILTYIHIFSYLLDFRTLEHYIYNIYY